MLTLNEISTIEGDAESEEEYYSALQRAINSGTAWSFQGSYGRTMMSAIEDGYCCLGKEPARDYYGNFIPSRSMVQEGTKGSIGFVRDHMGDDWAAMVEGV